ncbi:YafY family protein [Micromonospora sp. MH99]|uniref:helix-turn-helix transcriptional regulator n=1 Tax=Micromonospora sp. MH99 TaxID=1945510 RepID=UPI001F2E6D7D|nr:YafY family protein [Micromonospora sp. MH99]MCF0091226.1 Bifunctional ligase/repressor BirA [Micromonospora sp. MH99]
MLETSARLLRLLSLLQTSRRWSSTELAERLNVTTRTVRNDVERLRALGYPVHATFGTDGGYRLAAGAVLPPLLLDDEEAVAIAIRLRTATPSVAGIEESSARALAKLEQVLPTRLRNRINALQTYSVAVSAGDDNQRVAATTLSEIAVACRDRQRLRFDYRSHDASESRREAEPYRLVNWGRRWYLVGWDIQREDWRTYRVDRMTLRLPHGPRFLARPLPDSDVGAYVMRGIGRAVWRHRATIIVHLPAEVVVEKLPSAVGPVEFIGRDRCRVRTGSDNLEQLAVWFGLLGADFEVIEPPELLGHLRMLADRYRRAAGDTPSTTRAD